MSDPQLPNPIPQFHDQTESSNNPPDPLLKTGSYIDPDRTNSAEVPGNLEFSPGVVIAAEPISMFLPGEDLAETPPRSVRRRNPEEMSKRPNWLPEDWKIDLKVRSSGASAGLIDRYYVEPSGQRRFRSKIEVLHFLETGNKPKRKSTSETDTGPCGNPASQKQKKSSTKRKKSDGLNSDITHLSPVVSGVQKDTLQQT